MKIFVVIEYHRNEEGFNLVSYTDEKMAELDAEERQKNKTSQYIDYLVEELELVGAQNDPS